MQNKAFLSWGAAFLFVGIIFGAFGAHALKEVLPPESLSSWKTGVQYQLVHGVALLALGSLPVDSTRSRWILWLLVSGVILFSGSIYLLSGLQASLPSGVKAILGPMTPVGGLCMITAWLLFLIQQLKSKVSV